MRFALASVAACALSLVLSLSGTSPVSAWFAAPATEQGSAAEPASDGVGQPYGLASLLETVESGEDLTFDILGENDVRIWREIQGWRGVLFDNGQFRNAPGSRSVAVTIEIEEEGEGWPEFVIGAGFLYGFQDIDSPFLAAIHSPENGGLIKVLQSIPASGLSSGQSVGGSATASGNAVRLRLREMPGGMLEVSVGGSTIRLSNALTASGVGEGRSMGLIVFGRGVYRLTDLQLDP